MSKRVRFTTVRLSGPDGRHTTSKLVGLGHRTAVEVGPPSSRNRSYIKKLWDWQSQSSTAPSHKKNRGTCVD